VEKRGWVEGEKGPFEVGEGRRKGGSDNRDSEHIQSISFRLAFARGKNAKQMGTTMPRPAARYWISLFNT